MDNNRNISAGQFTCLILVSSVTALLPMNSSLLGGEDLSDNLFSCLLALAGSLLLTLPSFLLQRIRPKSDLLMQAQQAGAALLYPMAGFYLLYILFIDIQYLSVFQYILRNTFSSGVPSWIFTVMLVLVALYAACRGLEAIGRTAVLLLVLIVSGILFLGALLLPEIRTENLTPLFYHGPGQMLFGAMYLLSGSYGVVTYALLFPSFSGNSRLGMLLWNGITWTAAAFLIFLIAGVLGRYGTMQLFPLYSAATAAQLGTFQRMDTVFLGLWVVGIFLKLALGIHLLSLCVEKLFGSRFQAAAKPAAAVLHGAGAITVSSSHTVLNMLTHPFLTFPLAILAVGILPLLTGVLTILRDRRRNHAA